MWVMGLEINYENMLKNIARNQREEQIPICKLFNNGIMKYVLFKTYKNNLFKL